MLDISEFIGPIKTPAMNVRVIANDGSLIKQFRVPEGFQLERYVDKLYPENELMVYETGREVNVSVLENHGVVEVYVGEYL